MKTQNFFRSMLLVSSAMILPAVSNAGFLDVNVGLDAPPPLLPVYQQPACPSPGFIWTPGYWAYDNYSQDYFWVSGTWVKAPAFGLLWTPGYWGENDAGYVWHDGYWANDVGFYGGIDYGFGYLGTGFVGGYWHGRDFVYNTTTVDNYRGQRISFNGPHGIHARPSGTELRAAREPHREAGEPQRRQADEARKMPARFAGANHGHFTDAGKAKPTSAGPRAFSATRISTPTRMPTRTPTASTTSAPKATTAPKARSASTMPNRRGSTPPHAVLVRTMPNPPRRELATSLSARLGTAPSRVETRHPESRPGPAPATPRIAYHPEISPHPGNAEQHRKGRPA